MDIEKIASDQPEKIITTRVDLDDKINKDQIDKIIKPYRLTENQKEAIKVIEAMYNILLKKDASLIEINPLIITKDQKLICLDAKMNFDDNAIFEDQKF